MPERDSESEQAGTVAFLGDPASHGGREPEVVVTHAARIFLVGDEAYKLKRAVKYPFLDFTSLAARERVCRAEIELNRRTAPELYLDCLPVVRRDDGSLAIGGEGRTVDWLVHMRRFDAEATLDRLHDGHGLPPDLADRLAEEVVALHGIAERAAVDDPVERVAAVARSNLDDLAADPGLFPADEVEALSGATGEALRRHGDLIRQRAAAGEVRRCHGDLHLGNIALIDGRPVIFDALEFDDDLATTDVLYDLAFLLMDCWERGWRGTANRILNRWIARRRHTADLDGLALLPLFLSMRAAVRAKVAAARAAGRGGEAAEAARREARAYLDAAVAMARPAGPVLVAVGGFSGSGKSSVAVRLAPDIAPPPGAVVLRSDQIRKELAGVDERERLPKESYSRRSSDEVYAEMRARAARALRAGQSVVADAVHGTDEERGAVAAVAAEVGVPFGAIWLAADETTLSSRVGARTGDASDATAAVVAQQVEGLAAPGDWPHVASEGSIEDVATAARTTLQQKFTVLLQSFLHDEQK